MSAIVCALIFAVLPCSLVEPETRMIPTSVADLRQIAPKAKATIIGVLAGQADGVLHEHGINANAKRLTHFWAQASHETDGFATLEEYASGRAYEGRKDLGNTVKGDGVRYKGRGIFMLTGRYNYRNVGKKLGLDLESNPVLAAEPIVSLRIAALYWTSRRMHLLADADDWTTHTDKKRQAATAKRQEAALVAVTRAINGGKNGLPDRRIYTKRARSIFEHRKPAPNRTPEPEVIAEVTLEPEAPIIDAPAPTGFVRIDPDVGPKVPIAPTAPLVDAVRTGDLKAHPGAEWKIGIAGFGAVAIIGLLILF